MLKGRLEDQPPQVTEFDIDPQTGAVQFVISGYAQEQRGEAPAGTTPLVLLLRFMARYAPPSLREIPASVQGVTGLAPLPDLLEGRTRELIRAFAGARIAAFSLNVRTDEMQMMGGHDYFSHPETDRPFSLSLAEVLETLDTHYRQVVTDAIAAAASTQAPVAFTFHSPGRLGTPQAYEATCAGEFDPLGVCQTILGTIQNVTARHLTELALLQSESKLRAVIDHTRDAISIKDLQGRLLLVNPQAARALGAPATDLLGQVPTLKALDAKTLRRIQLVDEQATRLGQTATYDLDWVTTAGTATASVTVFPFWVSGVIQGSVCIAHDITQHKRLERELRDSTALMKQRVQQRTQELERFTAQLKHAALHDELTGLPNRTLLMQRLEDAVGHRLDDDGAQFAVLFLDFDHFKLVNDSLGHAIGDELLRQIADRLRSAAQVGDTVARLGGDEFVILAHSIQNNHEAELYALRLHAQFLAPFLLDAHELRITASIGLTSCDHCYTSASDVVRDADIAMYRAKAQSRGSHVVFEPAMRDRQMLLLGLQSELGQALRRGELRVHYQPIVTAQGRQVSGVEALVRWQHPVQGLIPPAEFIALAEERGLICELDLWVLRQACSELLQLTGPPRGLGVNFSARHFQQPGVYEQIRRILDDTGYPAHKLIVEITERLLLTDDRLVITLLQQLQDGGIQVAIDDFGTGYSSLRYIQQLPLNIIKIDRAFSAGVRGCLKPTAKQVC